MCILLLNNISNPGCRDIYQGNKNNRLWKGANYKILYGILVVTGCILHTSIILQRVEDNYKTNLST